MPLGPGCALAVVWERVKMSFCLTYCTSCRPSFTVPQSLAFHRRVSECRLTSSQGLKEFCVTNGTVNWKGGMEGASGVEGEASETQLEGVQREIEGSDQWRRGEERGGRD